ncbi:hypothetical protein MAL08_12105 [Leptospira noguchii]|nr:hypothetical protein [Leptospira noguchii]UOG36848.1 hypothetical protein MAL08_12105 [Leptospira noguchii]
MQTLIFKRRNFVLFGILFFFAFSPIKAITVEVFVPLCDGSQLLCGKGKAGDPRSLKQNLYWGAAFGVETFLNKKLGFQVLNRKDGLLNSPILRELKLVRNPQSGEQKVFIVARAYAGDRIDDALNDFLKASSGKTNADLVVWMGHDRLMDRIAPDINSEGSFFYKPVVVLACESETYFGPVLRKIGAAPIVMTRTFMAPEAYLLNALVETVSKSGPRDKKAIRSALIRSYAKYQRISIRAAGTVFSKLDTK